MTDDPTPSYAEELGRRLREIRQQQGLSLHGVQAKSGDRWKAVVVGSYERGDRAITAHRLAQLAEFYDVPLTRLLPDERSSVGTSPARARLILDLPALRRAPVDTAGLLVRYVSAIQDQRGDYNGRVLSLREDDLRTIGVLYDLAPESLLRLLESWGVLMGLDDGGSGAVDLVAHESGQHTVDKTR